MPMPDKNRKKGSFSEKDAATLAQRYDTRTLFKVLQEIAHYPNLKIDWNELVKKTSTGISNAREYQMLWHHLAYREPLPDFFEEGAQPLEDNSDLDFEVDVLPSVSAESTSDATAYAKVMMASRTLSESTPSSSTIESPLTINVPICHSSRDLDKSSQPSNLKEVIFPVTVQRQTLPTVPSADGLETRGLVGSTMGNKRKRKAWSEEEDMQLRAAVQRWGEGNWANMAKGDNFPIKRSATQLAQRWSILRKKDGSANSGTTLASTQYTTAEQQATRHSLSLALDMPFTKLTAPGMAGPARTSASVKSEVKPCITTEVSTVRGSVPPQHPSQRALLGSRGSPASIKNEVKPCNTTEVSTVCGSVPPRHSSSNQALLGSCGSPAKSKLASEKSVSKCNSISDRELKHATVHSGTQTVSRPNTISQLKVAQAKNAVDTVPVGSSLTKTSVSAGLPSNQKDKHVTSLVDEVLLKVKISDGELKPTTVHSGAQTVSRSNTVSQFKAAQAKNAVGTVPVGSSLTKTTVSAALPFDQKDKHVTSAVVDGVLLKQIVTHLRVSDSGPAPKGKVQEDEASTLTTQNQQFKVAQAKDAVSTVSVGCSLTKTSVSTGLPSDQKDKHVTSVVDGVFLKQEVNPAKDLRVSDPGSTPKGKVQEREASTLTTQSQVNSNMDKGRLDKDKGMPSEKISEHKAVSQNPGGREEQGRVETSNFTSKTEGTENENDNPKKGSQDLDQDKETNSINGSSSHQNMNEKQVHLPIQEECSQGMELPR